MLEPGDVGVGDQVFLAAVFGLPLPGAGGALDQLPLVAKQHVEVAHIPAGGIGFPGALNAAGGGIGPLAAAVAVGPAQAHLLQRRTLRRRTHQLFAAGTMGLAEGVAAGGERHGLLVVHGHAREGLAHVEPRCHRIGHAIGPLWVYVDQPHLHGGQWVFQLAIAAVALIAEPGLFVAPVDVFLRLPDVGAAAAEAKGAQPHRFEGGVAGQDHQVGPGDAVAVFLLDRPEQAAGLVEVAVIGPAVDRREALVAGAATAPAIGSAVGAGAVPGHAYEQAAVVAPIRWPPLLRVGHQRDQVALEAVVIEVAEGLGIVEPRPQRIGDRAVLMQDRQIELLGPPIPWRGAAA